MKSSKKKNIDRTTALEYIYEFGIKKAAELLELTDEQLENIVEEKIDKWQKPHINKGATIEYLNPKISEFIESNYLKLHNHYVKNKTQSVFWQDDEDIFHNSLIKLCTLLSNPSDELLLKEFDKIFKTNKWENQKRNNQMRIKEKAMKEYLEDEYGNEEIE